MSSSGSSNKPRTVKLRCPSVSSKASFFAWDEQRLDLGSIARTFGLDPSTLKLNGYFISRGADLISSSVTWRSLLSFFSAKGLSTGKDDKEALIVDGKLSKVGSKRAHDPQSASSRSNYRAEVEGIGVSNNSRQQRQDIDSLMNKRMKESNSGCYESYQMPKWNGLGFKRKWSIEHHVNLLKKLKINGANSGLELTIAKQRRMQPLTRLLSTDLEFINGDESESSDGEQFLQQLQLDKRKTKIRSRVNEQVKPMGKC